MVEPVGDDVHVRRLARPAHGDVGELPAAAVGEDMSTVDGSALHPVHRHRVGVVEPISSQLLPRQRDGPSVVEAHGEAVPLGAAHGRAVAGDVPPVTRRGEVHHPVPTGEPLAARHRHLGAEHLTRGDAPITGELVEGSHVPTSPRQEARVEPGPPIGVPSIDGGLQGLGPDRGRDDAPRLPVPADGGGDLARPQLLEGSTLARQVLPDVLVENGDRRMVPPNESFEPTPGTDCVELR